MKKRITLLCLFALIFLLILSGCQQIPDYALDNAPTLTPTKPVITLQKLRERPLQLPTLPRGADCPTTSVHRFGQRIVMGSGPIYVVIETIQTAAQPAILQLRRFDPHDANASALKDPEWRPAKALWFADTSKYQGIGLVRGRQLDGSAVVLFDYDLSKDLELPEFTHTPEEINRPSYIRINQQSPGCYGLQIDGSNFTDVIIFQVKNV
uniref:Lipoprotein n=1 Tax=Thermosporothrix sp. COM3 TaxID=2490863 RepID=A0A455SM96_9CHLR|nr:hypothetical protein KTC_20560 [Thermosporothrix sp. COM3]